MATDTASHFLRDLGPILLDQVRRLRDDATGDDAFTAGQVFAHFEVLSLLLQQAEAFGLDAEAVGLADVDPCELLAKPS